MTSTDTTPRGSKARGLAVVSLAYVVAAVVAAVAGWLVRDQPVLVIVAVADVVATLAVFGFSVGLANSSVYDAYWSVAPLPIVAYLMAIAPPDVPVARQILVVAVVGLWGLRLTWNWARGWPGLHHEDWRYVDIRGWSGRLYWPASLLTIHLLPTAFVFGGLLSAWVALSVGTRPWVCSTAWPRR